MFTKGKKIICPSCKIEYSYKYSKCPFCEKLFPFDLPYALPPETIIGDIQVGKPAAADAEGFTYYAYDMKKHRRILLHEAFVHGVTTRRTLTCDAMHLAIDEGIANISGSAHLQIVRNNEHKAMRKKFRRRRKAHGSAYYTSRIGKKALLPVSTSPAGGSRHLVTASLIGGRERQEDSVCAYAHGDYLFSVVCDGIGSLDHSDMVSRVVSNVFLEYAPMLGYCYTGYIPAVLEKLVLAVNSVVSGSFESDAKHGTTLVCAVVRGQKLYYASVGDSRIYRIHGNNLLQLNNEHIYLNNLLRMVSEGKISYDDAMADPKKHALTSFIGVGQNIEIDISHSAIDLEHGERILLCTDGLFNTVSPEDISAYAEIYNKISELSLAFYREISSQASEYQDNATWAIMEIN